MKGEANEVIGALTTVASNPPSKSVHFCSRRDDWSTPSWLFDRLDGYFHFTLDPCSSHKNAKCRRHYTREDDGLKWSWKDEVVFMNPPYGREIGGWIAKAHRESQAGATVVCLVPARTDTAWWHDYAASGEVHLVRGRLNFGDGVNSAPFPSAVVVFRPPFPSLRSPRLRDKRDASNAMSERHAGTEQYMLPLAYVKADISVVPRAGRQSLALTSNPGIHLQQNVQS
jgi:site-specific DNA-methyltransferase (adenine-specific)